MDVPDSLDLSPLRATGLQEGEELLPQEALNPKPDDSLNPKAKAEGDPAVVSALVDMGFPPHQAQAAARATRGGGVEEAMSWCLEPKGRGGGGGWGGWGGFGGFLIGSRVFLGF